MNPEKLKNQKSKNDIEDKKSEKSIKHKNSKTYNNNENLNDGQSRQKTKGDSQNAMLCNKNSKTPNDYSCNELTNQIVEAITSNENYGDFEKRTSILQNKQTNKTDQVNKSHKDLSSFNQLLPESKSKVKSESSSPILNESISKNEITHEVTPKPQNLNETSCINKLTNQQKSEIKPKNKICSNQKNMNAHQFECTNCQFVDQKLG